MRSPEEGANGDSCLFYPRHVNEPLMELLSQRGKITKDELMATIERTDREMEEKGESRYLKMQS